MCKEREDLHVKIYKLNLLAQPLTRWNDALALINREKPYICADLWMHGEEL